MIYSVNIDLLKEKIKSIILYRKWEDVAKEEAEAYYDNELYYYLDFYEYASDIEDCYYNGNRRYEFTVMLNKEARQVFKTNYLNDFIFEIIDFDEVGKEDKEDVE